MKIREGAYYRTRDGYVVGPMKLTGTKRYPWTAFSEIVGDLLRWTPEGDYSYAAENPHDLISEVYVSDKPPADVVNPFQNCTVGTYAPETKTLRDEFAGYAIIGLLAAGDCHAFNRDEMAVEAYRQADAMMEARNK